MIKITEDILTPIYQDALSIRQKVFVQEQGVPTDLEIDDNENKTIHFVYYHDGQAVGTLRILPRVDSLLIQRFAVLKAYRHQQIGRQLLQSVANYATQNNYTKLTLHAQLQAKTFYEKAGFQEVGEHFMEANIWHVTMVREL